MEGFEHFAKQALKFAKDDHEACQTDIVRVIARIVHDQIDEVAPLFYETVEKYPEQKSVYYAALGRLVDKAHELDRYTDAYEIMEYLLPKRGQESFEDLELFQHWRSLVELTVGIGSHKL